MLKTKKKGFTIVELVIVIAVIAILAAVLIPTFASIIENSNKSAAMQSCKSGYSTYIADGTQGASKAKNKTFFYDKNNDNKWGKVEYGFICDSNGQFPPQTDASNYAKPGNGSSAAAITGVSKVFVKQLNYTQYKKGDILSPFFFVQITIYFLKKY